MTLGDVMTLAENELPAGWSAYVIELQDSNGAWDTENVTATVDKVKGRIRLRILGNLSDTK